MKNLILSFGVLFGLSAQANLNPLAVLSAQRPVECYGEDNISIELNAKRTAIKYTVEGESNGSARVNEISTDRSTYVSYKTREGMLTFNSRGSYYRARGEETTLVHCKMVH